MAENVKTEKFINYVKEAFRLPFHLVGMGLIGAATLAATALPFADNFPTAMAILLAGVGAELSFLGYISRSPRFVRAINAKHKNEIDKYYQDKALVDFYNQLGVKSQQRFQKLQKMLKEVRDRFTKVGANSPNLVSGFLSKLHHIETSFVRLLYYKDKFLPEGTGSNSAIDDTVAEIDLLNQEIKVSSGKLKELKIKRLDILNKKMENFMKMRENKDIIEERLQTFEHLVEYFRDQPVSILQSDKEDVMIDNILFDAEQTQESLAEIESMMQSEFSLGGDNYDYGGNTQTNRVKE